MDGSSQLACKTMENPTPFDLNEAIRLWQKNLGASPAFKADNLEELASHLRASVQRLQSNGLSEEEGFLIALRRIGERGLLEREYAKVNSSGAWATAALWMVMGVFLFDIGGVVSGAMAFPFFLKGRQPGPNYFLWANQALQYGWTALLILFVHRLVAKRAKGCNDFVRRCLDHPLWMILALVGFVTLARFLPLIVSNLTTQATTHRINFHWRDLIVVSPLVVWPVLPAVVLLVLARNPRREV